MTEDPSKEHNKDHVWSSVDTTRKKGDELKYNLYPEEQQVLLLPEFCFMVVAKEQKEDQITIKVLQMPHQDMLKLRQIQQSQIIWIDPQYKMNKELTDEFDIEKNNPNQDFQFTCVETVEEAMETLNNTVKAIVITSG